MLRREFILGTSAFVLFRACDAQTEVLRYAKIAGVAAASIGRILGGVLGEQITLTANAVVAAAEQWSDSTTVAENLISAMNALKIVLETIPSASVGIVVSLIPIVIAALDTIFAMLPVHVPLPPPDKPITIQPGKIPHHFPHNHEQDFEECWNDAARNVKGAVIFK